MMWSATVTLSHHKSRKILQSIKTPHTNTNSFIRPMNVNQPMFILVDVFFNTQRAYHKINDSKRLKYKTPVIYNAPLNAFHDALTDIRINSHCMKLRKWDDFRNLEINIFPVNQFICSLGPIDSNKLCSSLLFRK